MRKLWSSKDIKNFCRGTMYTSWWLLPRRQKGVLIRRFALVRGHLFKTYVKFSEKLTFLTPWNAHVRVCIVSSPLTLGGRGISFLKFGERGGSWKNCSEIGRLVEWGGLLERWVSKLFHQFSFRKACFHSYWYNFFVWWIFTLAVIYRSILSCGLIFTRKWYIMKFLFLLLLFLTIILWKFHC